MRNNTLDKDLSRAHDFLVKASGLLVGQVVRRKFRRYDVQQALALSEEASTILRRLTMPTDTTQ